MGSLEEISIAFKQDYKKVISQFYHSEKEKYLKWAKAKTNLDHEDLVDIYQDAIIIFYNKVIKDEFQDKTMEPKAYLFGIAKTITFNSLRNVSKNPSVPLDNEVARIGFDPMELKVERENRSYEISKAFNKLSDNCKEILNLYYYRSYNLEAISHHLGYDNPGVVKSRKYQCMKSLISFYKAQKS